MAQPESFTCLAAMAGATRRIRLLSNIVIAPLRPAGLLAKTAATLHALSRGRYAMGVSVSWHQEEYDALGVPFHERGQILDETLEACRALWTTAPASFHGQHVNFENMYCSPRPGPGERIPILFGGQFAPRLVRRIVSLGDGWLLWNGLGMDVAEKRDAIAPLKDAWCAAKRDPAILEISEEVAGSAQGEVARCLEHVPRLARGRHDHDSRAPETLRYAPDDVLPVLEEVVTPLRALPIPRGVDKSA